MKGYLLVLCSLDVRKSCQHINSSNNNYTIIMANQSITSTGKLMNTEIEVFEMSSNVPFHVKLILQDLKLYRL